MSYFFLFFLWFLFLFFLLLSTSFACLFVPNSAESLSSYECGFEPSGLSHVPFCINFFLLAIIFLVFDVEVAFLLPSLYNSYIILSFVLVLLLGLVFEYSYGGLTWLA